MQPHCPWSQRCVKCAALPGAITWNTRGCTNKDLTLRFACENMELFHEQFLAPHGIVVQSVLLQFTESCLSRSTINACFLGFKIGLGKKFKGLKLGISRLIWGVSFSYCARFWHLRRMNFYFLVTETDKSHWKKEWKNLSINFRSGMF